MFGVKIPRDAEEALKFDKENSKTKWKDSMALETSQRFDYRTFFDLGIGVKTPERYTKIKVHMVFVVKHDGRYKSHCVAGGHMTPPPIESVYSGVVSMHQFRLITFLAELNDLELYSADIGNAYLEVYTKENVCFVAGKDFGDLEGHTMIVIKVL